MLLLVEGAAVAGTVVLLLLSLVDITDTFISVSVWICAAAAAVAAAVLESAAAFTASGQGGGGNDSIAAAVSEGVEQEGDGGLQPRRELTSGSKRSRIKDFAMGPMDRE